MRIILALMLCSLLSAAKVSAQVSDDERARTHFESGRSYYEQARYDDAAREFQEAFQLSGRPALLLNLSQAYERALLFDQAIAELQHYLQLVTNSPDRKTLEERIQRLQELRARVQAQPQAAPNQPAQGVAPYGQPAAPLGPYIPPGAAAPNAQPAQPGYAAQNAPYVQPPQQPAAAASAPEGHKSHLAVPGWILVGTGGAALVGSLVTGIMAHGKYSTLSDECKGGVCTALNAQSDIDSGKTLSVVSTVLMLVGVVAGGIGTALLVVDAGKNRAETAPPTAAVHARLAPGPTPLGMGAALTF